MVSLHLITFAWSFFASWLTGGLSRVLTWLSIISLAFKTLEKSLNCVRKSLFQEHFFLSAWCGHFSEQHLCLFLLQLPYAGFHRCSIIHSPLPFPLHHLSLSLTCTYTHTLAQRGKSICVRHSARERQRHWVNYPSFTAAEESRWQQTICKWQGAVNYSIFLD